MGDEAMKNMARFSQLFILFLGIVAVSGSWSFVLAYMGVPMETKYFPMLNATPIAVFFVSLGVFGLLLIHGGFGVRLSWGVFSIFLGFVLLLVAWVGLDFLLFQTFPRRSWK